MASRQTTSLGAGNNPGGNRPTLPPDIEARQASRGKQHTAAQTDAYLESKLVPHGQWASNPVLDKWYKRSMEEGVPDIGVSPMQGQFLSVLAKGMGAEKILETLELSPLRARLANELFLDADLYPFPKVHVGSALDLLRDKAGPFANPLGSEEGLPLAKRGYDLVFIDADKERTFEYFMEAVRLTRKGGIILLDNAVRGGRIVQEENDEPDLNVEGLRKLFDWVEKDAGKTVLVSGIQTVGSKFWDGFAMAVKL